MKTIYVLFVIITALSCDSQNKASTAKQDTLMKTFDIKNFNENKNNLDEYIFVKNNITVKQYELKESYFEFQKKEDEYFEQVYEFYKTGTIKASFMSFPNDFTTGILKEYNEEGTLIKEEDLNKPFVFSWENIKQYLLKHEVENIEKQVISIRRFNKPEATEYTRKGPYWNLEFKGEYKGINGQFLIELDGKTGEELLVKQFKGKGTMGESGTKAIYDTLYQKYE